MAQQDKKQLLTQQQKIRRAIHTSHKLHSKKPQHRYDAWLEPLLRIKNKFRRRRQLKKHRLHLVKKDTQDR